MDKDILYTYEQTEQQIKGLLDDDLVDLKPTKEEIQEPTLTLFQ